MRNKQITVLASQFNLDSRPSYGSVIYSTRPFMWQLRLARHTTVIYIFTSKGVCFAPNRTTWKREPLSRNPVYHTPYSKSQLPTIWNFLKIHARITEWPIFTQDGWMAGLRNDRLSQTCVVPDLGTDSHAAVTVACLFIDLRPTQLVETGVCRCGRLYNGRWANSRAIE